MFHDIPVLGALSEKFLIVVLAVLCVMFLLCLLRLVLGPSVADRLLADGVLDIVQYPYNMINRTKEDVLKYYAGQGCGTMGYGSLGGGILTGQFREVPTFGHGDMRASFYGPMFTEPGFSQIQTLLKVMDGIAETHKATVAQVAIN